MLRSKLIVLCLAIPALIFECVSFSMPSPRPTRSQVSSPRPHATRTTRMRSLSPNRRSQTSQSRRFIGYHGTSREGFEVLNGGMSGFRSHADNQLGPGLYTADLKTAQVFAGRDGVIAKVYANGFSTMSYFKDPAPGQPGNWTRGVWTKPENQHFLNHYDFLVTKHLVTTPKGDKHAATQIKFNPRAYHALSFELYTAP